MQKIKALLTLILFAVLLISCASGDRKKADIGKTRKFKSINNIAVQTFACPDPATANDVRNIIIASLLNDYSVIIGDKADVVISGTITLHSEQVPPASSVRASGRVKAISYDIMQNGKILDSVSVAKSPAYDTLEAVAGEIAKQIAGKLSKLPSCNP